MRGLLEFVFEGISPSQLSRVVIDSIGQIENVTDATLDGSDLPLSLALDAVYLSNIASAGEDTACLLNLRALTIADKRVERVTLQITHYGNNNDLSVLLSNTDCLNAQISTAVELYAWAKVVSEKYEVKNFYGGLEPAFDENTQLYSKDRIGPILTL